MTGEKEFLLEQYVAYLREWNTKVNLVSRKDEENIWLRQMAASSCFLVTHRLAPKSRVLDLGTGGGLPGIPIAILCPEVSVVLVDSIAKKVRAVEDMIRRLKLSNATAVCSRAEDLRGYDRSFDYVIARAVGTVSEIVGWSRRLLKAEGGVGTTGCIPPGSIVLLKGGNLDAEISEAKKRHTPASVSVEPLADARLPELEDKKIVIIRP